MRTQEHVAFAFGPHSNFVLARYVRTKEKKEKDTLSLLSLAFRKGKCTRVASHCVFLKTTRLRSESVINISCFICESKIDEEQKLINAMLPE